MFVPECREQQKNVGDEEINTALHTLLERNDCPGVSPKCSQRDQNSLHRREATFVSLLRLRHWSWAASAQQMSVLQHLLCEASCSTGTEVGHSHEGVCG